MKSSAFDSKPFKSRSKSEIPGRARRKEQLSCSKLKEAFLSDSDVELFMYLIQCIGFGVWTGPKLILYTSHLIVSLFLYTDWVTKSFSLNPVSKFMAYLLEL